MCFLINKIRHYSLLIAEYHNIFKFINIFRRWICIRFCRGYSLFLRWLIRWRHLRWRLWTLNLCQYMLFKWRFLLLFFNFRINLKLLLVLFVRRFYFILIKNFLTLRLWHGWFFYFFLLVIFIFRTWIIFFFIILISILSFSFFLFFFTCIFSISGASCSLNLC